MSPHKRNKRKAKVTNHTMQMRRAGRILSILGIALLLIWGTHKILYIRSLRLSTELLSTFTHNAPFTKQITSVRIGLRVTLPVTESGYVNGNWIISQNKANHVAQSGSPGQPGNIILYAHNTVNLFGPLRWVSVGEEIELTSYDGAHHLYTVSQAIEVDPANVSLLAPTMNETLTLYTCSGFLDSKRWVVRAYPKRK